MRLLLPTIVSLWLLALPAGRAQSADDFFNSGAQSYISNNIPQAKESVASGLKRYPDDIKLKKLDELLKQQGQQQQQNQQNQQSQSNQKQQQQQQNQPAQNQSSQENDKKEQEQQQQEKSASQKSDEKQDGQDGRAQAAKAQEMTPEEAKRLLDAQKGDEKVLQ